MHVEEINRRILVHSDNYIAVMPETKVRTGVALRKTDQVPIVVQKRRLKRQRGRITNALHLKVDLGENMISQSSGFRSARILLSSEMWDQSNLLVTNPFESRIIVQ